MGDISDFCEGVEASPAQHPAIATDSHWFAVSARPRTSEALDVELLSLSWRLAGQG